MMPMMLDLAIWAQMPGRPGFGQNPGGAQGVPPGAAGAIVAGMICYFLFLFAILAFVIIVNWKIFTKAGEPGWASIIPIYNVLVMARICGRQEVFGLVYLIPCVGAIILCFDLAAAFGKDAGFAIGLLLLGIIFLPILAFGNAEHVLSRRNRGRRRRMRDDDDEDDEDDRPRGRRPADDDDEDEDDRPRRRPVAGDDPPRRRPAPDDRVRRKPDDEDRPRPRRRPADDDED
ncbi:MAG: DUF5684 domain-containing protein [Gemmataceae bacterium]